MIIYVNVDVVELENSGMLITDEFFRIVIDMYAGSRHLVIVERDIIKWYIRLDRVGVANRKYLEAMFRQYTTWVDATRKGLPFLSIDSISADLTRQDITYSMGVVQFIKSNMMHRTRVLVENIESDGGIVRELIGIAAKMSKIGPVNMEFIHGGGDDIPKVAKSELDGERVVAIVVDSDLSHRNAGASPKVRKLEKMARDEFNSVVCLHVLDCREIENIIPLRVLSDVVDRSKAKSLEMLREIDEYDEKNSIDIRDRFRLYFDCKNGFRLDAGGEVNADGCDMLAAYVVGKSDSLSKIGVIEGFGGSIPNSILASGESIASLWRELRHCGYWRELHWPRFLNTAAFCLSGDARRVAF